MTAGIDLCAREIREPPPGSLGRGFLFALRGIDAGWRFRRLVGAISERCRFLR